ncbi:hypothetical protein TNCV_4112081 [Trichonephila clavipes]|nr:hypothetical protein TNCV_4112081 [Trichonephila clavipes]
MPFPGLPSMPLLHGGHLNSRSAASPLVRLMEGTPDPQGVLLQNCGGTELNRTVPCMVKFGPRHVLRPSSEFPCWLLLVAELFYQLPPRGVRWD